MSLPQAASRRGFWAVRCLLATGIVLVLIVPKVGASNQPLTCNPSSLSFGKVVLGQTSTLPASLTNTGNSSVVVSAVQGNDAAFTLAGLQLPLTLAAGQSVNFNVVFAPAVTGNTSGRIAFTSNPPNSNLYLPVRGTGVNSWALAASPTSLAFGNVQVGSSRTLSAAIINAAAFSVTVSMGTTSGAGFSLSGTPSPLTLGAGQSFTVSVTFAPQSAGSATGSITAAGSEGPWLSIPLMGMGTSAGNLVSSPATMDFGNVLVGSSSGQTGTLTASGASVTVYSATSNNAEFMPSGLTFPLTIAAGQGVLYGVTFSPQSSGQASALLSFASNAANSPASQVLDGNGMPPESYIVTLNWQPSSSQVVGYNIYRGNTSGGPYSKINATLDPDTNYVDNSVAGNQTYYYVTTAVNSNGQESSYSNQAQVTTP